MTAPSGPAPNPDPPPAGPGPADALLVFLASRDVPCPHCHYNLRGVSTSACPECGRAIELQLAGVRRSWVPPIFMFLAFGWMLTAGAMNTWRNAAYVWDAAHTGPNIFITSVIGPQRAAPGSGPVTITARPGGAFQFSQSVITPTTTWGNVTADLWIRLSWSSFLVLAGVLGVAVLWRHLSRPLSPAAWARARLLAIAAFAIYAGFHLYWFAIEML